MRIIIVLALLSTLLISGSCKQAGTTGKEKSGTKTVTEAVTDTAAQSVELNSDLFTNRDMQQTPDLSEAEYISLEDGKDVTISSEGVYVLSGNAKNVTVYVDADDNAKVQIVLDGVTLTNTNKPCIYVKNADKVFVTSVSDGNTLSVSGSFTADGDTNTDAVIFSKDDLVLNGTGKVTISSTDNGIAGKDDIKVTGGTWQISCEGSAIEAHEGIMIADGNIEITKCNDGIHAEDSDDDTTGFVYIGGGSLNIKASDDGIHATTSVQIDGGNIEISAAEGVEGTIIQINGGTIDIEASDDGINAAQKSSSLNPSFKMNDGNVTITMGQGDTDGVDSNGDIVINGGTISITGQSAFDYDGTAEYNGGTIIENGQETNTITNQMFGGPGGMGGQGQMGNGGNPGMPGNMQNGERPEMPGNMGGQGRMGKRDNSEISGGSGRMEKSDNTKNQGE